MFISFPTRKTINEYKSLRLSQKEIKISSTSKQLDNYVYNKRSGLNYILGFGTLTLFNVLFYNFVKAEKPFSNSLKHNKIIGLSTLAIFDLMSLFTCSDYERRKKHILDNPELKRRIYIKNGINAVI